MDLVLPLAVIFYSISERDLIISNADTAELLYYCISLLRGSWVPRKHLLKTKQNIPLSYKNE